jgi:hypothetical protein
MEESYVPDPILDDIDLIFSRAGMVDPPEDFFARVMTQARAEGAVASRSGPRVATVCYALAYVLALLGLALLAYELGMAIAHNGTGALLATLAGDAGLLADAPGAYLGALLASIPWLHIVGVAVDLAILAIVTRLLLHGVTLQGGGRQTRSAA